MDAKIYSLLTRWDPEDDPIATEQVRSLLAILNNNITEKALEGFLIIGPRLIDEFGHHRTHELASIFKTQSPQGKKALVQSLESMRERVGGMTEYKKRYPVTIIPPMPAFPQFKIIGLETLANRLYRVLDSGSKVYQSNETLIDYIVRTKRLPEMPVQTAPVLREKANYHWCSYGKWNSPDETANALQILPNWSDCRLRATILTKNVTKSAYMAFNGDKNHPNDESLRFYKYFYEPLAQDHPPQIGGGSQIALEGEPPVEKLELWDSEVNQWRNLPA